MMKTILIIGGGEIGTAIEHVLHSKNECASGGCLITIYDNDPVKTRTDRPFEELLKESDCVFFCVPSWALRPALKSSIKYIKNGAIIISLSKGIEEATHMFVDDILDELVTSKNQYALLSGPMLAEELMQDMRGYAVVATHDRKVYHEIEELFSNTKLSVSYSSHVHAVALAGVLKNIYSVGLGIAEGLSVSGNTKGVLVSSCIHEMVKLSDEIVDGASEIFGVAGLGDFIATGFSPYSRNRQIGDEFVKKGTCSVKGEGSVSISSIHLLIKQSIDKYPLFRMINSVVVDGVKAEDAFKQYL
jgi:glycerol-3-phosphate dehydrogenase (NAD(P)+)